MLPAQKGWAGFTSLAGATIAGLLLLQVIGFAQDVTEPALKAVYIYNFALFTEWPAGLVPPEAPFVMCVHGDSAVGEALERTYKGRAIGGHPITVSTVAPDGPLRTCQVLYTSRVTPAQATQLVAGVRDLPVLTLSDLDGFTELGGIAQFFFEHGRLRFTVSVAAAMRAHLQISSKLLRLAKPR